MKRRQYFVYLVCLFQIYKYKIQLRDENVFVLALKKLESLYKPTELPVSKACTNNFLYFPAIIVNRYIVNKEHVLLCNDQFQNIRHEITKF